MREPRTRLNQVDACVTNGQPRPGELGMTLASLCFRKVGSPGIRSALSEFRGMQVHAVAGIGNPQRFFDQLRGLGLEPIEHPFPDHYRFQAGDIRFNDEAPVVMTEKDAVKCQGFAGDNDWYLVVEARPNPKLGPMILASLQEKTRGQETARNPGLSRL